MSTELENEITGKCEKGQHDYKPLTNGITRKKQKDGKTEIHQSFFCVKCANIVVRHIATWDKWEKEKKVAAA